MINDCNELWIFEWKEKPKKNCFKVKKLSQRINDIPLACQQAQVTWLRSCDFKTTGEQSKSVKRMGQERWVYLKAIELLACKSQLHRQETDTNNSLI